jgi:hypothetical protein
MATQTTKQSTPTQKLFCTPSVQKSFFYAIFWWKFAKRVVIRTGHATRRSAYMREVQPCQQHSALRDSHKKLCGKFAKRVVIRKGHATRRSALQANRSLFCASL